MSPLFADPPVNAQPFIQTVASQPWVLYGAGAVAGLLVLLVVVVALLRRGDKKPAYAEGSLEENLSEYPLPPATAGPWRLTVHGRPMRLRLVVVAPVGKRTIAEGGAVEALLDQVIRGLGQVAQQDKPRMRIWPPQLSQQGFAPTFFRLTRCPDRAGQPSHWLTAAGPARAGGAPILLGLAMWGDEPAAMEQTILSDTQWDEALQVKKE